MLLDHLNERAPDPADVSGVRLLEDAGVAGWFTVETNFDGTLAAAVAAAGSTRLTIGTAITIAFSRNPVSVAYTAHGLQGLSRGRFVLGLGTQVKAHVERRFGMPYEPALPRMREFLAAYAAVWSCWEGTGDLDFQGEYYTHTLMPEPFRPRALRWPRPPVWLAAVGPRMAELAGEVADGVITHPFCTARYVDEVIRPRIDVGARRTGRAVTPQVAGQVFVATGTDDEELAAAVAHARGQVGFYASTPTYRPVLDLHGWGGLHDEARALVRAHRWKELAGLVDDEVLDAFVVRGRPEELGARLVDRYAGVLDRMTLMTPYGFRPSELAAIAEVLRAAAYA
ncbi:TIGR03617 family F420-dependent LLM class oxidoreductase [Pseudonocardia pini]|uniref:TIGR03617 family F420-dependent LLM class oxidoreductase n=1 Tax=Pseudonocardia pini TaxID=2758030 RepID=UPI0015F072BF|nr:TIGR03617 family F420-dependent LLM class oxidoreductase [Pseudonocardia pini]